MIHALFLVMCLTWIGILNVSAEKSLLVKYNSVCFDRNVDGKFCCLAEIPNGIVRSVCLNYDGTFHHSANRYAKIDDLINMMSHPVTFPKCDTSEIDKYPRTYPCVDDRGNFRIRDKAMSPEEYFKDIK